MQPTTQLHTLRTHFLHQRPEATGMVLLNRMAQFVQNNIIDDLVRQFHQLHVQTDIILSRATPPVRDIVAER